ncbi:amino acid ABC transporter permease [Lederbergia lenta]|uniref:amino acid ABC transporter permease n=1 Tax=Lederbergia lenta TaxID=1467 RepID=UPI0020416701|nr:amino acid ABC transporter permease [Lederbergia lenta]MCM3110773.1 amino acid ABC transporter permease [Lederbergia lenta]
MHGFDLTNIIRYYPDILPYLAITFLVVIFSMLFGVIFGFLIAMAKLSKNKILNVLGNGYTNILRCTPSIILLFLVYYGLPEIIQALFGVDINHIYKGIFVIITLALLFSANMAEVMRSAYESVDKGQFEAGVSIGLNNVQTFIRILLPQCFVIALPNLGNAVIALFQEGALAFTIGFIDMMGKTNLIVSLNYGSHAREIYISLALIYWAISIIIEKGMAKFERIYKERILAKTV